MALHFCTLDLGALADARSWQKGCLAKGLTQGSSVLGMTNGVQSLTGFFHAAPDWVYLSGHYGWRGGVGALWAQREGTSTRNDQIWFLPDRVLMKSGDGEAELRKGEGLQMHRNLTLLIWGGCSALRELSQVRMMRALFENPTILGYKAETTWSVNNAMLGGGNLRVNFFSGLSPVSVAGLYPSFPALTSQALVHAWLEAGKCFAGTQHADKARAIDDTGQVWDLAGGEIVKGDIV